MAIKAVIADLDGTVILGSSLIPGADSTYENLKAQGIRWIFMSNNAGVLAEDLADKLNGLGIKVTVSEVLNSASALINELKINKPGARLLVIGSDRLKQGLRDAGIIVEDSSTDVDIVVSAFDKSFNYQRLEMAQNAIHKGALFWATNRDAALPVEDGLRPGAGTMVAAIATAAGKEPDRVFGKPSVDLANLALEKLGVDRDQALVVGDRMETDILFAKNAGLPSALVLTGAASKEDIGLFDFKPDHIIDTINHVASLMGRE